MKKILIIRFSSIGDIVLTTPVIRCLKQQLPDVEIHYLTKKAYREILEFNPYIDKAHYLQNSFKETIRQIKRERFDFIVDLHKSLRSLRFKLALQIPSKSFPKLNFRKWWLVQTKRSCLPDISIVDRYFEAVKPFNIVNDGKGLDFFMPDVNVRLPESFDKGYIVLVCGGKHNTKQIPLERIELLCRSIQEQIILLGDQQDAIKIKKIESHFPENVLNGCGKYSLNESASIIAQSLLVITPDTGLMHISAALRKKIISVWGNTVPAFGMFPYFPDNEKDKSVIMEVKDLSCRPCSKIGYPECPKKHFNCMQKINYKTIIELANNE